MAIDDSNVIAKKLHTEASANKVIEVHSSRTPSAQVEPTLLNCDHGNPTMFEAYWDMHKCEHVMVRNATLGMSYFATAKKQHGGVWFMLAELDIVVRALHALVGNAITKGRFIVVGIGSTQLFQAALYALAGPGLHPPGTNNSTSSTAVVAQSPYYSAYPHIINYLQSKLFHWAGDSRAYQPTKDETCIEMVTLPNNPCGEIREGLVKSVEGSRLHRVYDLAYYWPTYIPITTPLDHDIMLFTLSKCTGHAGVRIGWAIVKNPEVAKKMADYVVMNTIGVSQDAQGRAAGIMQAIVRGYEDDALVVSETDNNILFGDNGLGFVENQSGMEEMLVRKKFFHWSKAVMEKRWGRVRIALAKNQQFSLLEAPLPAMYGLLNTAFASTPGFIWLRCEEDIDCQMVLKKNGILGRGGVFFGVSPQYARLSLLDRECAVEMLIKRLEILKY